MVSRFGKLVDQQVALKKEARVRGWKDAEMWIEEGLELVAERHDMTTEALIDEVEGMA